MNTFAAWFNSKSFSTHTIAITAFALAGIVASDAQVKAWITQVCGSHVGLAAEIIGFCVVAAKYSHSSSEAGTVANAKIIMSQPAPPHRRANRGGIGEVMDLGGYSNIPDTLPEAQAMIVHLLGENKRLINRAFEKKLRLSMRQ